MWRLEKILKDEGEKISALLISTLKNYRKKGLSGRKSGGSGNC
jgi:hypothetical protein